VGGVGGGGMNNDMEKLGIVLITKVPALVLVPGHGNHPVWIVIDV
jgi:hypothetical protein